MIPVKTLPSSFSLTRQMTVVLLAVMALSLAACGSTKVYTADKSMTYKGSLYNMSQVQRISTRMEGTLPGGETVDMSKMDKKAVQASLKENKTITVTSIVDLDEMAMVYERRQVKSYSEYSKMKSRFESAVKKINKFMADAKKTQLKL